MILTTPDEIDLWMTAPADRALKLQRPLPDGVLSIVAIGGGTLGRLQQTGPMFALPKGRGVLTKPSVVEATWQIRFPSQ